MSKGRLARLTFILLTLLCFSSYLFAETETSEIKQTNYFVHPSGVFRIKPPVSFNEVLPNETGVQFNDKIDKSYIRIGVTKLPQKGYTDTQYLDSFRNKKFLEDTIRQLEQKGKKIISNGYTTVNGIPAYRFRYEVAVGDATTLSSVLLVGEMFFIYKNNTEFLIIVGAKKELFDKKEKNIEDSLATFEIL